MTNNETDRAAASLGILQLGHPGLRIECDRVNLADTRFPEQAARLQDVLENFKRSIGFGRAIAAPQIGISKRLIAFSLSGRRFLMVNPVIASVSPDRFLMWDDCMSFPDLIVKVERHHSVSVRFEDESGAVHHWYDLPRSLSELIQHELDHLDGVLAIDRAVDHESLVSKTTYRSMPDRYESLVDPTPNRAEAEAFVASRLPPSLTATTA